MDALGIVYPQYWLQPKPKTHLAIINATFCQLEKVGFDEVWVLNFFSIIVLDLQRSLFVFNIQTMST
jgi:hypothetical protein